MDLESRKCQLCAILLKRLLCRSIELRKREWQIKSRPERNDTGAGQVWPGLLSDLCSRGSQQRTLGRAVWRAHLRVGQIGSLPVTLPRFPEGDHERQAHAGEELVGGLVSSRSGRVR